MLNLKCQIISLTYIKKPTATHQILELEMRLQEFDESIPQPPLKGTETIEQKVEWLDILESACRQGGIHGTEFAEAVHRVTRDSARDLVDKYGKDWQSWREVQAFWKNQFRSETCVRSVLAKIMACKQGDDTVKTYNRRFSEIALVCKVLYNIPEVEVLLPLYLEGLDYKLRLRFKSQLFSSLNHAMRRSEEECPSSPLANGAGVNDRISIYQNGHDGQVKC